MSYTDAYVRSCDSCGRRNPGPKNRATLQNIRTGYPFERIGMDFLGPFKPTQHGNKYILVIVDHYTKWPECFALPSQDAASVARTSVNELLARYGAPVILRSDRGSHFENRLDRHLCDMFDMTKTRTTAYHAQCSGLVERMNHTLLDLIAKNVDDADANWDLQIGA